MAQAPAAELWLRDPVADLGYVSFSGKHVQACPPDERMVVDTPRFDQVNFRGAVEQGRMLVCTQRQSKLAASIRASVRRRKHPSSVQLVVGINRMASLKLNQKGLAERTDPLDPLALQNVCPGLELGKREPDLCQRLAGDSLANLASHPKHFGALRHIGSVPVSPESRPHQ